MSVNMNWSYVCNHICHRLLSDQPLVDHLKTLSSNAAQVQYCLSVPFVRQLLDQFLTITGSAKHQKYWEKAKEFRIEGNDWFRKKCFEEAIEAYNQAIIFASIPGSNQSNEANSELSLSFANRSAVFLHLKEYDNCLTDICNAFKYEYPLSRTKLLLRKVNCFLQKQDFADAQRLLDSNELKAEDIDEQSQNQIKKLLEQIEGKATKYSNCINRTKAKTEVKFVRNELMPNASQSVRLSHSPTKGRHFVANEDIEVSDILFMEKPFSSVLLPQYYQTYCHHCYRRLGDTPVMPCLKCSQVRYCSEQCANESWDQYHNYECGLLDVMHDIGVAHLAFRTLLVCGIETAVRVSTSTSDTSLTPYLNEYKSVYALVDHSDDIAFEDRLNYSLVVSLLLVLIENLGLVKKETKNSEILAAIIFKHILQLISNAHAISSVQDIQHSTDVCFEDKRIATALYPTVSLCNHSCEPNVTAVYDKSLIIVRAAKPIAKGQEVMNCYGPHAKRMSTKDRQRALKEQYFFDCDCNACSKGTEDLSCALLCPDCQNAILLDNRAQNSIVCQNCKKNDFNSESMLKDVQKGLRLLDEGSKLIDDNMSNESELKLLESERILEKVLYSKNRSLGKVKDQLSRCYASMNEWSKAVAFGRQSVEIVSEVFGETSVEMSNELIKLSEIEFELFNANKTLVDSVREAKSCLLTTSKAIRLLANYSIPGADEDSRQMQEIRKLEERLVFCDLFVKQFFEK